MMRHNRAWLVAVSVFVLAAFLGAAALEAANESGKIVLTRKAVTLGRSVVNPFGSSIETGSCYGACNCSTCVCNGSLGCCIDGCEACWEFLDDGGACGAQQ